MIKYTKTIRRQIANELFECVWPFCEIGAKRINELNKRFLKFSFNGKNKSIEESMISFCRTHSSWQRINNKPIQVGDVTYLFM